MGVSTGRAQHRLGLHLRVIGRRYRRMSFRALRHHDLSLGSAAVIGALFMLVMTSDSFVSRETNAGLAPAASRPAASSQPVRQRPSVVFFVVQDQAQLRAISSAFADDQEARAGGP